MAISSVRRCSPTAKTNRERLALNPEQPAEQRGGPPCPCADAKPESSSADKRPGAVPSTKSSSSSFVIIWRLTFKIVTYKKHVPRLSADRSPVSIHVGASPRNTREADHCVQSRCPGSMSMLPCSQSNLRQTHKKNDKRSQFIIGTRKHTTFSKRTVLQ